MNNEEKLLNLLALDNLALDKQDEALDEKDEARVVAIYGSWGVGKTYFYKDFVKNTKDNKDIKHIYLPLIGKSDIEAIKDELVLQLANRNQYIKAVNFIAKFIALASSTIKINNISFDISKPLSKLVSLFESKDFANTIICFDDLERMDSSILDSLFGLINELKEHKNCKIILIFNRDRLKKHDLFSKDKIIDMEMTFSPSVEESFNTAERLSGIKLSDEYLNVLKGYCKDKGINNIRVIKRMFVDMEVLKKEVGDIAEPKILEVLVRFSYLNTMHVDVDLAKFIKYYSEKVVEGYYNNDGKEYATPIDDEYRKEDLEKFREYILYMEKKGRDGRNQLILKVDDESLSQAIYKVIIKDNLSNEERELIKNFKDSIEEGADEESGF